MTGRRLSRSGIRGRHEACPPRPYLRRSSQSLLLQDGKSSASRPRHRRCHTERAGCFTHYQLVDPNQALEALASSDEYPQRPAMIFHTDMRGAFLVFGQGTGSMPSRTAGRVWQTRHGSGEHILPEQRFPTRAIDPGRRVMRRVVRAAPASLPPSPAVPRRALPGMDRIRETSAASVHRGPRRSPS